MTAEEYFNRYYPNTYGSIVQKTVTCTLAEDYAKYKLSQPQEKVFKPSMNGVKMSALISDRFGISLQPLLHRRYIDAEKIKFEMQDNDGNHYFFEGLVMEFLDPSVTIFMQAKTFSIAGSNSKTTSDYRIQ